MEILNDHINMRAATGAIKAVPIWQIKQWIGAGIFDPRRKTGNAVGYDFVDYDAGLKDMAAYAQWEAARAVRKAAGQGVPRPAEEGIASVAPSAKNVGNPAFSATPENFEKPADAPKAGAPERAEPKDVIDI